MDLRNLVDEATQERLAHLQAGHDVSRRLRIATMRPGDVGVLEATVRTTAPARTFRRKNGTEGLVGRVTLDDGTGEVDAVLWDDMNRLTRDGTLSPGQSVRMRGVAVQEGWRGGIELSLESAQIDAISIAEPAALTGTITHIADTQIVEDRFQADITLETSGGPATVVVWDDAIKEARAIGVGGAWSLQATPHPLLDGWWLAQGDT